MSYSLHTFFDEHGNLCGRVEWPKGLQDPCSKLKEGDIVIFSTRQGRLEARLRMRLLVGLLNRYKEPRDYTRPNAYTDEFNGWLMKWTRASERSQKGENKRIKEIGGLKMSEVLK